MLVEWSSIRMALPFLGLTRRRAYADSPRAERGAPRGVRWWLRSAGLQGGQPKGWCHGCLTENTWTKNNPKIPKKVKGEGGLFHSTNGDSMEFDGYSQQEKHQQYWIRPDPWNQENLKRSGEVLLDIVGWSSYIKQESMKNGSSRTWPSETSMLDEPTRELRTTKGNSRRTIEPQDLPGHQSVAQKDWWNGGGTRGARTVRMVLKWFCIGSMGSIGGRSGWDQFYHRCRIMKSNIQKPFLRFTEGIYPFVKLCPNIFEHDPNTSVLVAGCRYFLRRCMPESECINFHILILMNDPRSWEAPNVTPFGWLQRHFLAVLWWARRMQSSESWWPRAAAFSPLRSIGDVHPKKDGDAHSSFTILLRRCRTRPSQWMRPQRTEVSWRSRSRTGFFAGRSRFFLFLGKDK